MDIQGKKNFLLRNNTCSGPTTCGMKLGTKSKQFTLNLAFNTVTTYFTLIRVIHAMNYLHLKHRKTEDRTPYHP